MTPTKGRGSQNYIFDRRIPGVGRIRVSAKTAKRTDFRYRDGLITKLVRAGAIETLRMLQDGRLTILDLVDADHRGVLERVPDQLVLRKRLRSEVDRWLPDSAPAPESRRRYKVSWERFLTVAGIHRQLKAGAVVEDLRFVNYRKLRRVWNASPADWNRARAAVSAFLSAFLGSKMHPFRLELMQQFKAQQEPQAETPNVQASQFWSIITQADTRCQSAYVTMAALGAYPGEYLALTRKELDPGNYEVFVPGTKNAYRPRTVAVDPRLWDWVDQAVPSPLAYRWLNEYWKRACRAAEVIGFEMRHLRHLSAQLAGDRGATDRDLTVHLGHATPTMSHRYSRRRTARTVAQAVADELLAGRTA
jgi:integrase